MSADHDELVDALKSRIEDLARTLLGEPNRLLSNKSSWRYGRNGSLVIELTGNRRGLWFSHEDGEGGGPIQLIQREQGLDAGGAVQWARGWLGRSFQAGDSRSPKASQRAAPSSANSNRAKAPETKPEPKEDPAAYARRILAASIPIAGTVAELYLREHRGISGELPEQLRFCLSLWHKEAERSFPALIVPAFWPDGALARVQAIYLDPTGVKAGLPDSCKVKKTFGRGAAGVPAVFQGAPGGPFDVLLAEGVEDALSLRFALNAGDIAATLGAGCLHKIEIAEGTRVCIVADNDAAGAKAAQRAAVEHTLRGCEVWIATPPAGTKDANALLLKQGPAAVLAMVEAAERFEPAPPPARRAFLSAEAASEALRSAIDLFFDEALRPPPQDVLGMLDLNNHDPFHAIKAPAGLGKSRAVLRRLADPALADKHITYAVPTVELAHELKAHYDAMAGPNSPRVLVILGREQTLPSGESMCRKIKQVKAVTALGLSPQRLLCKRKLKGREALEKGSRYEFCPHFHECPYQRQVEDQEPAIRVMPHQRLFLPGKKDEEKAPDIVVIDESFHGASLRGFDRCRPYIVIDRLTVGGAGQHILLVPAKDGRGIDYDATAELDQTGGRCARALHHGGKLADFQAEGVTEEDARIAMRHAYRCVASLAITPSMSEELQDERIEEYQQQEALRIGRFFRLLQQSLRAGIDPRCFEVQPNVKNREGHLENRCYMRWSADLKIGSAAVLMIDADLDEEVARRFVPKLAKVTEIEAEPVHYEATQIIDRRVSMGMTCVSAKVREAIAKTGCIPAELDAKDRTRINNCKRLHRLAEAKAAGGRRGLVVSYKAVEEALRALPLIEGVEYAHFSALRGVDRWKDCDFIIIAGSPQVNEGDLEKTAEALWHLSPEPIRRIEPDAKGERRYTRKPRRIEMADGGSAIVTIDEHPDERCERLLDLIRREVSQAAGRVRLIHRQPDKPCEIIILTNTPIPGLPIHKTTTWQQATEASPLDLLMARGLIPEAWRDAETLLSDMIESERGHPGEATRRAFERAELPSLADLVAARLSDKRLYESYYRRLSESHPFRFRVRGRRQSARILIDLNQHPDPKAALERVFGRLDRFEALEGAAARAADEVPAAPPPALVEPAEVVADTGEISDLVAPGPSQPGPLPPMLAPEPVSAIEPEPLLDAVVRAELEASLPPAPGASASSGSDEDPDPWLGWPGPDPATMPRVVIDNSSPKLPEPSDAELLRLLPPKRPTDNAVSWEIRAHDVLRAWGVGWFRAQRLVKEQSAAHDWSRHRLLRLASARDSP
jgi:hypothetical protein